MSVAPDGTPVDLYLMLPPGGEAEIVDAAVPEGAEILELGCGPGRVTHELLRLGHPVVGVDESSAMLAHVRGNHPCADRGALDRWRALYSRA